MEKTVQKSRADNANEPNADREFVRELEPMRQIRPGFVPALQKLEFCCEVFALGGEHALVVDQRVDEVQVPLHLLFRVQGSGFRVQGSGFGVQGSGFGVQGLGFRVQGSGFGV